MEKTKIEEAKIEALREIAKRFNQNGVKYVVCGAFASKLHGVENEAKQMRPTKDYDFIIDGSETNVRRIKKALLEICQRVNELREDDFEKYTSIQIIDDREGIIVDLILRMWEIDYEKAHKTHVIKEINGVKLPVMSIDNLLVMKKDSFRPQDKFDTYWLKKIKKRQGK